MTSTQATGIATSQPPYALRNLGKTAACTRRMYRLLSYSAAYPSASPTHFFASIVPKALAINWPRQKIVRSFGGTPYHSADASSRPRTSPLDYVPKVACALFTSSEFQVQPAAGVVEITALLRPGPAPAPGS